MTDASSNLCECGTAPKLVNGLVSLVDGKPVCEPLDCKLNCGGTCSDTGDDFHSSDNPTDPHHLGRVHKVCRFSNDASCHSCPTSSCQYPLGNFWGSGFPCINQETNTWAGGDTSTVDGQGKGLSFDVTSEYSEVTEKITFCPTDGYALNRLDCGKDKVPTIVSPKTCTHCQVARCVSFHDISRYLLWNPQFVTEGVLKHDGSLASTNPYTDFSAPLTFWRPGKMATHSPGWTYLGCYVDNVPRILYAELTEIENQNTNELCRTSCFDLGYRYAATEAGYQCFCGDEIVNGGALALSEGQCNIPCVVNGAEMCGGSFRMSMWYYY